MEFDDFSNERDNTQKILNEREKIKNQMEHKLRQLRFSDDEIDEVLDIIEMAEAKIERVKVSLNGTNINTDDPTPKMQMALDEIKILQTQMALDIRTNISEILSYKNR